LSHKTSDNGTAYCIRRTPIRESKRVCKARKEDAPSQTFQARRSPYSTETHSFFRAHIPSELWGLRISVASFHQWPPSGRPDHVDRYRAVHLDHVQQLDPILGMNGATSLACTEHMEGKQVNTVRVTPATRVFISCKWSSSLRYIVDEVL
jgi:hypothetical protein